MLEVKNYQQKKKFILLIALALILIFCFNFFMILKILESINLQQAVK